MGIFILTFLSFVYFLLNSFNPPQIAPDFHRLLKSQQPKNLRKSEPIRGA